jgi:hypothetical protein
VLEGGSGACDLLGGVCCYLVFLSLFSFVVVVFSSPRQSPVLVIGRIYNSQGTGASVHTMPGRNQAVETYVVCDD